VLWHVSVWEGVNVIGTQAADMIRFDISNRTDIWKSNSYIDFVAISKSLTTVSCFVCLLIGALEFSSFACGVCSTLCDKYYCD